ncbi:unnamed protein product, partial [marine sediment metagenome]
MRLLKANEIEVRVGMCKEKGASLLLYKNARVDMQILDETFGEMNWKREHKVVNGNNYCAVSVYNDKINEWISKEDCGTESMTEKQKGEASDAFKRACVNWGIGRELYTPLFMWITTIKTYQDNGKWKTKDKFKVKEITYNEDREIESLVIINQDNKEVFTKRVTASKPAPKKPETKPPVKKKETKPEPKPPIEKPETEPEPKPNFKKKLGDLLVEMYGVENASAELKILTTFINKEKKTIQGKD